MMTTAIISQRPSPPPRSILSNISVVQLNMGRNSAVNLQLLEYCLDNKVDVALVQEPYIKTNTEDVSLSWTPFQSDVSSAKVLSDAATMVLCMVRL